MFTICLILKHDPPYQQRYLTNLAACRSSAVLGAAAGRRRQMDVLQGDRFSPSCKEEAAPAPLRLTHKMLTNPAVIKRAYAEKRIYTPPPTTQTYTPVHRDVSHMCHTGAVSHFSRAARASMHFLGTFVERLSKVTPQRFLFISSSINKSRGKLWKQQPFPRLDAPFIHDAECSSGCD